jgi:hypothetical protein
LMYEDEPSYPLGARTYEDEFRGIPGGARGLTVEEELSQLFDEGSVSLSAGVPRCIRLAALRLAPCCHVVHTASLARVGSDRDRSRELDDEHAADEDGLLFDDGPPESMPEHPTFTLFPDCRPRASFEADRSGRQAGLDHQSAVFGRARSHANPMC